MGEFFEPPSPPEPYEPEPRYRTPPWIGPPQGALPAAVPCERVLARTETVAVCLARLAAYPTGFELRIITMSGETDEDLDPFMYEMRRRSDGEEIPPEVLRLGVQFADGSKATNISSHGFDDAKPSGPTMIELGGGGGGGHWEQDYWVWPLPAPGPLALVCEWPAVGVPLTRHEVDAALILDAASRAQVVISDDDLPEWPAGEDGPGIDLIR